MVMVIIGILAAVVGPRFFDRQVFDERLYYEQSLAAVRYAQKLAVASGCLIQVSLDNNGYRLRRASSCSSGTYTSEVQGPDGQSPFAAALPSGVNLSGSSFPVVFDSLGRPSAAASATLGAFTISVNGTTGLVQ